MSFSFREEVQGEKSDSVNGTMSISKCLQASCESPDRKFKISFSADSDAGDKPIEFSPNFKQSTSSSSNKRYEFYEN